MAVPSAARIGNYRVVELLGSGGMGEVYLVEEISTGARRAMKTLRSGTPESEEWQRFLNEGQVHCRLRHPNIAEFHEMFLCDGRPCLVMEYVDGETLYSRIYRKGPLPVDQALAVLGHLCGALSHLHERGIVHRDLKSANIKITSAGLVKLLDFGIAKEQHQRGLTMVGTVLGTPEHLAPEQLAGTPADTRTEVWALGLLAYEMLTARLPFQGADEAELYGAIRHMTPPQPSTSNRDVPPELDKVVLRCLEKRPSRRFQSTAELLEHIGRSQSHMTNSVARPTNPGFAPLTVSGSYLTDVGPVRTSNEDSVRVVVPEDLRELREKGVLAVVADGMGGHEGGEVASGMAVERVGDRYYRERGDPQQALLRAFETANRDIFQHARKHSKLAGMGTTCTAVAVVNGMAYSAHVGDSRVYLVRDGQIYCMTEDHSATMEMVKQGMLTLAEARTHEERNVILRAMGTRPDLEVALWTTPFPLRPDDRLLLCSDGLYEKVEDSELAACAASGPPEDACRELIRLAIERVSSDNVSVAILQLGVAAVWS